jgi:uncharacterized glyoxalase superfamily protein PhnB
MSAEVVPVFQVSAIDPAVEYLVNVLGFDEDFRWGSYAGLTYGGGARLHLCAYESSAPRLGQGAAYFFVADVDQVWERAVAGNARIDHPIGNQDYGMRDFSVRDPDGNRLTFGTEVGEPSAGDGSR